MGSKNPKSETQQTFPPWLEKMLQPLIGNSVGRLNEFSAQGNNVLQGRPYQQGIAESATPFRYNPRTGGKLDPEVWQNLVNSRGQNG